MNVKIEPTWKKELEGAFTQTYFQKLVDCIKQAYQTQTIYPKAKHIFRAFDLSPFPHTKVVILGQDPYHGVGQADGLAFSVPEGIAFPPSLRNIFVELQEDTGRPIPSSGSLAQWAKQGVLLLNATLTVEAYKAGSHQKKGWEQFTDAVIQTLAAHKKHVVFILWGSYAQQKASFIDPSKHLILKAAHPSPLAAHRGFFHQKPFSKTNAYLTATGQTPIQW
jgi:uracil-DNA glycosylase